MVFESGACDQGLCAAIGMTLIARIFAREEKIDLIRRHTTPSTRFTRTPAFRVTLIPSDF
jgi:hypothetical protein